MKWYLWSPRFITTNSGACESRSRCLGSFLCREQIVYPEFGPLPQLWGCESLGWLPDHSKWRSHTKMVDEELLALTPALLLGCVSSSFLVSFFFWGVQSRKRERELVGRSALFQCLSRWSPLWTNWLFLWLLLASFFSLSFWLPSSNNMEAMEQIMRCNEKCSIPLRRKQKGKAARKKGEDSDSNNVGRKPRSEGWCEDIIRKCFWEP